MGVPNILELVVRILVASVCGIVIGYERQAHFKSAGVKTHMIVGFSAALVMIVSKYGFMDSAEADCSRIAAQLLSGMGFVGAGIIYKRKSNIEGLTTAAGMLAMSGIGLAIGAGMYEVGILSTALFLILRLVVQNMDKLQAASQGVYKITFKKGTSIEHAHEILERDAEKITSYKFAYDEDMNLTVEANMYFPTREERYAWCDEMMHRQDLLKFEHY